LTQGTNEESEQLDERGIARRNFLRAAAMGAAAVGVAAAVPAVLAHAAEAAESRRSAEGAPKDGQPMVAYVSDPASGEIVVMTGGTEVVRQDPVLVSRLVAHTKG